MLAWGGALVVAAAAGPAAAHTPYRQWVIYRKKHLLIGCHRNDDEGYRLAKSVAAWLDLRLPASSARVARAPAATRLASLIATDQLDIAVLTPPDIADMRAGDGLYATYGAIELTTLALLADGHALVAAARLRPEHAGLIADSVYASPLVAETAAASDAPAPWHPAALEVQVAHQDAAPGDVAEQN